METGNDCEPKILLSSIMEQFAAFLTEAEGRWQHRKWLETEAVRVYVRKTVRLICREARSSLDTAAIEIAEEQQGRGLFSAFAQKAHDINLYEVTYLEHVHSPIIRQWCKQNGWQRDENTFPASFYSLKMAENMP